MENMQNIFVVKISFSILKNMPDKSSICPRGKDHTEKFLRNTVNLLVNLTKHD